MRWPDGREGRSDLLGETVIEVAAQHHRSHRGRVEQALDDRSQLPLLAGALPATVVVDKGHVGRDDLNPPTVGEWVGG